MFLLRAEKNELRLQKREPLTNGSVNVYQVQVEFSADWEGLERTAVFKAGGESWSVPLDETGVCSIPWEALREHGIHLQAGVYGVQGEEIALPTVWADLGVILEGASPVAEMQPSC